MGRVKIVYKQEIEVSTTSESSSQEKLRRAVRWIFRLLREVLAL